MKKKKTFSPQFAFWRYDQFPFVLGGEVTEIRDDGTVETKNYGNGFYFRPFKMMPLKEGKELMAKLEALRAEHRSATETLNLGFTARLDNLITRPWTKS